MFPQLRQKCSYRKDIENCKKPKSNKNQPCKRLPGQNTLVGVGLIELAEPSDTMNCDPFFKYCILQFILHVFLLLIFMWNNMFCSFTFFLLIWFGLALAFKVLCFWCSFYRVIGYQGFISYSRYNLLGVPMKTVL